MQNRKKISIIGGGAWGTALANTLVLNGNETVLWALEKDCVDSINSHNINERYLKNIELNSCLKATNSFADVVGSNAVMIVVPAQYVREILRTLAEYIPEELPVILCSKGIELGTLSLMTDVLKEEIPWAIPAVLSGPSFAVDVAIGLPTAVTIAAQSYRTAEELALLVGTKTLRPYISQDLIGAEVGGAVKNVLAIACGIVLGLGLGRSAHSAVMARGFAEMTRLGMALGADASTLTGLCGLGDLVLTCSSEKSRNMSFGLALGRGEKAEEILAARSMVTEGASSAPALEMLSNRLGVDMPICKIVAQIIRNEINPGDAVMRLLQRPIKVEIQNSF